MFRPVLVTPPASQPVTLEECKAHSVIDYGDDDAILGMYIGAATERLDGFRGILGRCMVDQTWQVARDGLDRVMALPVPDVSSVAISYRDEQGETHAVPAEQVILHPVANGTEIRLAEAYTIPTVSAETRPTVTIEFTAGFGAAVDVPMTLKVAIMQLVRQFYDDRTGAEGREPNAMVHLLISQYRWAAS